jgi:phage antirepressor YoqD-like protein
MKKLNLAIAVLLISTTIWAQSPEKMSYQAVIRNSSNQLLTSQTVGMQISILQGTADGTPVYVETQTPTTNANGLVSVEIGSDIATVVSGNFSTIDWANGPFFIKTETDPAGETSYTITGISQLLSVPYALHAKTVETYTETDPEFIAWDKNYADLINSPTTISTTQIADITANTAKVGITTAQATAITNNTSKTGITAQQATDITANNAKVGYTDDLVSANTDVIANTAKVGITTAQATAITNNTAKTGITAQQATDITANNAKVGYTDDLVSANTDVVANTAKVGITAEQATAITDNTAKIGVTVHAIGDSYGGGIIFWLDATEQHGLIAATADQSAGMIWNNGTFRYTGTTGDGLFAGAMNTAMIVATQIADNQTGNFAAKVCADYSVIVEGVTYGDWYLPSQHELILLGRQKAVVGGFANDFYWSSREYNDGYAWTLNFDGLLQFENSKLNTYRVRAIRSF